MEVALILGLSLLGLLVGLASRRAKQVPRIEAPAGVGPDGETWSYRGTEVQVKRLRLVGQATEDRWDCSFQVTMPELGKLGTVRLRSDRTRSNDVDRLSLFADGEIRERLTRLPGAPELEDGVLSLEADLETDQWREVANNLAKLARRLIEVATLKPFERLLANVEEHHSASVRTANLRLLGRFFSAERSTNRAVLECFRANNLELRLVAAEQARAAGVDLGQRSLRKKLLALAELGRNDSLQERILAIFVQQVPRSDLSRAIWAFVSRTPAEVMTTHIDDAVGRLSAERQRMLLPKLLANWFFAEAPHRALLTRARRMLDDEALTPPMLHWLEGPKHRARMAFEWFLESSPETRLVGLEATMLRSPTMRPAAFECVNNEQIRAAVPILLTLLRDPELYGELRLQVLSSLQTLGDPRADGDVCVLVEDSDTGVVVAALDALAVLGTPASLAMVDRRLKLPFTGDAIEMSGTLASEAIRERMAEAERRLEQADNAGDFRALVLDPRAGIEVRRRALARLAAQVDADALTELARELLGQSWSASKVLGSEAGQRAGDPRLAADLLVALQGAESEARRAIAAAFATVGGEQAEASLINLLDDGDEYVQLAAIEALAAVGQSAALEDLAKLDRGLFGGGDVGAAARMAMEAIRERYSAGALSLAGTNTDGGELSLTEGEGALAIAEDASD